MTHIMLDIETWGRTPGSDIRSIGAVVFDPVGDNPTLSQLVAGFDTVKGRNTFYIATDNPVPTWYEGEYLDDNRIYPLTREHETVEWWNKQSVEAQTAFANPVDLHDALEQFTDWFDNIAPNADMRIWANDPHFDCSILAACYRAVGLSEPWHYRAPRSMKTITEAAGMTSADYSNYGDAHNALDDAIAQAMTVCEAYKRLGLQK